MGEMESNGQPERPADGVVTGVEELARALERRNDFMHLRLGDMLVAEGHITEEQLGKALAEQSQQRHRKFGEILVSTGGVSPEDLRRCITKRLGIPMVDLGRFRPDPDAIQRVPRDLAQRLRVVPIATIGSRLIVATEDPLDHEPVDMLAAYTNMYVEPVLTDRAGLDAALADYGKAK